MIDIAAWFTLAHSAREPSELMITVALRLSANRRAG